MAVPVFAAGDVSAAETAASTGGKALAAGIAIAVAAGLGALAMGIATAKAAEAMARQPEIKGDIRTNLILGIVFMETAIIYALIVAILIIFVM
ncbi:MAG: F0F1 ATP synthase subunit C [Lachnospiraceae bacterium]|nr:F0F1 ATP synthase subunit C [Lachnospiraceae bacterium]